MNRQFLLRQQTSAISLFCVLTCLSMNTWGSYWSVIDNAEKETDIVALGDTVTIKGSEQFSQWIDEQFEQKVAVHVHLNGRPLVGTKLRLRDAEKNHYAFEFDRKGISETIWPAISARTSGSPYFSRRVDLSFGDDRNVFRDARSVTVQLLLIRTWVLLSWAVVLLGLLGAFLLLAVKSNILRAGPPQGKNRRPRLSLASTQMAFWLFIVIVCYIGIWLINGNLSSTNDTVLILLGISAGTYLGATLIEATTKKGKPPSPVIASPALAAEITGADGEPSKPELAEPSRFEKWKPEWLITLLSDNTGVKLHRFQIMAWTLVLGIIFITETFKYLRMPELPGSVLGLLGISSSTYLGFKFPEMKVHDQASQSQSDT